MFLNIITFLQFEARIVKRASTASLRRLKRTNFLNNVGFLMKGFRTALTINLVWLLRYRQCSRNQSS